MLGIENTATNIVIRMTRIFVFEMNHCALSKSAKFAKFCVLEDEKPESDPKGSRFWSLNGSKLDDAFAYNGGGLSGLSFDDDADGGSGAARNGVLLAAEDLLGGAGLGGGALLFFGGNAGVGLSDRNWSVADWFESNGENPNGSPWNKDKM